jgi:hypothetical protein
VHSSGREQRYIRFLVLSSEPIFSFKDSKKAWLIAVVLSLGNAMNGQPDVKTGELYVADADMKTNVAYALPVDLAKSLQKNEIEVWLVALPSTTLYLPYRISVPTAFGSGAAEMLSFHVNPDQP